MSGFNICPAQDGGYLVRSDFTAEVFFAGTLYDCLEYIRDRLSSAELARNREAVS